MRLLVATLAVLVLLLVLWVALRPAPPIDTGLPAGPATAPPAGGNGDWFSAPAEADATGDSGSEPDAAETIALDPDAIASLRGAREFGDPRTPPIARDAPREQATPEELADPEKYAEFEARQERKIKRAYVIEAEKYVRQLRADIDKGKAMGIPPEEIAKVEEKVRRIEAMRAELLARDPGLLEAPAGESGATGNP